MPKNQKYMQFANFNITFGQNEDPMLEHFEDVIFPAFTSDYKRCTADKKTYFYFADITLKEVDGDILLVGNIIKDTQYDVFTTLENGRLISNPSTVPTAPYSRFIINLKNHRMALVCNEPNSPDIRSFQALVKSLLDDYRRKPEFKEKKLPFALVNIVDIPLQKDIQTALSAAEKIKNVKLRFFPLNNDINPLPLADHIANEMKSIGSNHANITFTSPQNPEEVVALIATTGGLAAATVEIQEKNGKVTKIKEGNFASKKSIELDHNINSGDDTYILHQAKQDEAFIRQSDANLTLFEKFKNMLLQKIK